MTIFSSGPNKCPQTPRSAVRLVRPVAWMLTGLLSFAAGPEARADCYSDKGCGGNQQTPCTVWQCLPSCRSGLYEDFQRNKCMQRTATNSFPTINPAAAAFATLASALDGWTQSCVATANEILPKVPVSGHLDFSDIKSTALFGGSEGARCSEQFDFGWACGASSYVASYVKLLSIDVDLDEVLANPVVKELLAAWASPQCSMFILPQQRAVCAALLVGKKELPVVEECIADFIDETFPKAGRSAPPTDNQRLYDQVCQSLGTLTYGFTVDQSLGVLLDELTVGGSTAAATAKDVNDFVGWAKKLYTLLHLSNFVKEHAERIPACRKLFRP